MSVTLELFELRKLLTDQGEIAARNVLISLGLTKPTLSAKEAYTLYGRKTVERWVREGLITPHKDGPKNSAVRYAAIELEVLSKSSNRLSYFLSLEQ